MTLETLAQERARRAAAGFAEELVVDGTEHRTGALSADDEAIVEQLHEEVPM